MQENSYQKGITLIEVLASLLIIALLSALSFAINRQTNQRFNLLRSANKLAQDIRRAQQMAMAATEFHGAVPEGGYGIYLFRETNTYILFADCDNNHQYISGELTCIDEFGDGFSEIVEEISLEKGVKIKCLYDFCWSLGEIVFAPPDPTTYLLPFGWIPITIQISLETDPTKTKTISVNPAGLIEIR